MPISANNHYEEWTEGLKGWTAEGLKPSPTRPDSAVKDGSQAERVYDYLRSRPSHNVEMTHKLRRRSLRHPFKTR